MPDKHSHVVALQEKVELLIQALEREKNAKRLVEEKLTRVIDENFEQNKAFFEAFEQANSRQIQLQFLASITSQLFSVRSIEEMFSHFISRISELLSGCNAITISSTSNEIFRLAQYCAEQDKMTSISWDNKYQAIISHIEQLCLENDQWTRIEVPDEITIPKGMLEYSLPLLYKLKISASEHHIILLDIEHYCYSNNLKQTLNTAAQQFAIAINRRIVEIDLSYNYHTQKLTLRKLEAAQNQLIHNEKMASLGELSAGIAHEINNPLGFINSNLQVLDDYRELFEQAFKKIDSIESSDHWMDKELNFARSDIEELIASCITGVKRISTIVTSLKTFSHQESHEYHPIEINSVIESSIQIVWNKLKYNYMVNNELTPNLPKIKGSIGELQQVFVNILINAFQAMEASGTGTISINSRLDGHNILVTVRDTGCGMNKDTIKHLFEPFFTTKKEGEGTGLGLSLSYAILEKHNATINAESEVGKGTKFNITFPVIALHP